MQSVVGAQQCLNPLNLGKLGLVMSPFCKFQSRYTDKQSALLRMVGEEEADPNRWFNVCRIPQQAGCSPGGQTPQQVQQNTQQTEKSSLQHSCLVSPGVSSHSWSRFLFLGLVHNFPRENYCSLIIFDQCILTTKDQCYSFKIWARIADRFLEKSQ